MTSRANQGFSILEKDNFSSGRSLWKNKLKDSYSKKEENQMVLRFLSEAK